jgi:hypothetical protein
MTHTEREWRDGQPEGTRPDEGADPLAERVPEDAPLVEHVHEDDPLAEHVPADDPLVEVPADDPLVEHARTVDPLAETAPDSDPLVEEAPDKDPLAEPVPAAVASADAPDAGQARPAGLGSADDQERFADRWQEIQAGFVDEPRRAVQDADALVVDMMDRLARMLASEREQLESLGETGKVSTEDLRQGLRRYRSLFERLLAV